MWWEVLSVLLFNIVQDLAFLLEELEQDGMDFIDYREAQDLILKPISYIRMRRDDSLAEPVNSTMQDVNFLVATTIEEENYIKIISTTPESSLDYVSTKLGRKTLTEVTDEYNETYVEDTDDPNTTQTLDTTLILIVAANSDSTSTSYSDMTRRTLSDNYNFVTDSTRKTIDLKAKNTDKLKQPVYVETTTTETTALNDEIDNETSPTSTVKVITWQITHDFVENPFNSILRKESVEMQTNAETAQPNPTRSKPTTHSEDIITTTTAITETTTEEINTQSTIIIPDPVNMSMVTEKGLELIERQQNKQWRPKKKRTTTTVAPTTEEKKIDVERLLEMLGDMIDNEEHRINLTEKFNSSIQRYTIPTCVPIPTTTPPSTVSTTEAPSTIDFSNSTLVAKCYVCGLDIPGIPFNSACADAFASDFIPLVPVDAKSKGMISKFRKYCHYLNVNRIINKPSEPQSVFGRFTGGCSVRWVDLTGIYTQRACRNRRRAVLGKHFASKRMAKLEMALKDVSDGCIISPMATLLPVSRGISLYARFHACVCTGYWCNRASPTRYWTTHNALLLILVGYFS